MQYLRVKDRGTILEIGFEDLVKYHGRFYIGGVALAYKLMEIGFRELVPDDIPDREQISFTSGLGLSGPGVIDAVEMVTRAKTRGRLVLEEEAAKNKPGPVAPNGIGRYYFEVRYADRAVGLAVRDNVIPNEFMELSRKVHDETISETEKIRLQQVKEELAEKILAAAPDELFILF